MGASAKERQQLVDDNVSFVRAAAAKLKETLPREIEFDDLVAYGMEGLLEAAERYEKRFGVAFTTFAWYRVRGAMFDGLRAMGYSSRADAPLRFEERANAYLGNVTDRDAGAGHGDPPDLDAEVRDLADALGAVATIYLASVDEASEHPETAHEQRERRAAIERALASLPEKEKRLIELYYYQDKSLEEAGAEMGLSKSWSSRLHARAIGLLTSALRDTEHAPRAGPPPGKRRARR
jgi:RNA polymerase sigma factor for flagellar operon FliA